LAPSQASFGYNTKGEVTGSTNTTLPTRNQGFAYDQIGNRLSFTTTAGTTNYTSNSLNQYTQVSGFSAQPSYDLDGNQTTSGLGQAYVWDAENRLISVEPVFPANGDKKVINTYDAQSRRVRRQISTYASGAWTLSTDEKFVFDGWNVVAVLNAVSGNTVLRTYTWGKDLSGSIQGAGGVGGLLAVKDGSAVYHYTYDANGNVSEVLGDSGSVAAHYEYTPFGDAFVASGAYALTNEIRFSTKPLDSASGLYYYGFRYYNPSIGRWLSRDPIKERGGLNLYDYVKNSSLDLYDYLGLDPQRSNGFTSGSASGLVNCVGYAGSGGQTYNYQTPSERGVKGRSVQEDMEAEGWSCSRMSGPICDAECDYEKMVITNHMSGNDLNRGADGKMRDSFTDPDIHFGPGPNGAATDIHAIYAPSGCSTTYSDVRGRHEVGSDGARPHADTIPADFNGRQYCCTRKKK
jgi:RHS repeat-associated protein